MKSEIAVIFAFFFIVASAGLSLAGEYQWSATVPSPATTASSVPTTAPTIQPRAFLWIPPDCQRVRAVIFAQHNMLEEDILENDRFRRAMGKLGFAEVWVSPAMDNHWVQSKSGPCFEKLMQTLADLSGYDELATAPVVPIGHSACASFPWNFAAANPQRTLAILSIHGDAPRTPLAGFGPQHVDWPNGAIDGIPGLMAMGEYEWGENRFAPAVDFCSQNAKAPIAILAEPGAGHFAAADTLVPFLSMFLEKVAAARLIDVQPTTMRPIDPTTGWLVQRWTPLFGRTIAPMPVADYHGDRSQASWAIDEEMADAIQNYRKDQQGKKPQLIGFMQDGALVQPTPTHQMYSLKFEPSDDGVSFSVTPRFLDIVSDMGPAHSGPDSNNHVRWSHLPPGSPVGHAAGEIAVHRIAGPMREIGPNRFELSFERGTGEKPAMWFAATNPGDDTYESAVQQLLINVPRHNSGTSQTITFNPIGDVDSSVNSIPLSATSSAELPVRFFVREGPAEVEGHMLKTLPLPPRTRYPVRVTVEAWQWGRASEPAVQSASPVEQTFFIRGAK